MKKLILGCVLLLAAKAAGAAECKLWLKGDSTLHTYASTATQVNVQITPSGLSQEAILGGKVTQLELSVPVAGMQSESAQMDKNMRAALKAQENPAIVFNLARYSVRKLDADSVQVDVEGKLKIAGVERDVTLTARGSASVKELNLVGEKDILMTDYGVQPPTFMRMIKTNNKVVVHYSLRIPYEK